MIIDLDSHLREGYFMDEVYNFPEPYARFTPQKAGESRKHNTEWVRLDPGDPQGRAAHRHPYIYDPKVNWKNGEIAERQVAGYDMERRLKDIKKEGIDKQIIFPTGINVATENIGGSGLACAQSYNNWVANLVKGHEDVLLPAAMMPAGCPRRWPASCSGVLKNWDSKPVIWCPISAIAT